MSRNSTNRRRHAASRAAFSLTELMAVTAILGVLAVLIVPRVSGHQDSAKRAACYANQGDIETPGQALEAEQWFVSGFEP